MNLNLSVETRKLVDINEYYQENTRKAIYRAINKALYKGRVAMKKEISKVYKLKGSVIGTGDNDGELIIKKASNTKLWGTIEASKLPISMYKFEPVFNNGTEKITGRINKEVRRSQLKRASKTQGMQIEILKGNKKTVQSAFPVFSSKSKSGVLVMARGRYGKAGFSFGKDREPIEVLNSKSVYFESVNDRVEKAYGAIITTTYISELSRQLQLLVDQS